MPSFSIYTHTYIIIAHFIFPFVVVVAVLLFIGELIDRCDYDTNTWCNLNKNFIRYLIACLHWISFQSRLSFSPLLLTQMAIEILRIFISMRLMTALDVSSCSRLHCFVLLLINSDDKKITKSIKLISSAEMKLIFNGQGNFNTHLNMHVFCNEMSAY